MRPIIPRRWTVSFWPLQLGGWLLYGTATAVTYLPFRPPREEVIYRAAFLCSAFLTSFVMYALCRWLWRRAISLFPSLLACVAVSYLLGVICTGVSLGAEVHLGGSRAPIRWTWAFSGGVGAAFVLIAWSALYFGIKHHHAAEEQKARLLVAEATAREAQLQALRYQLQPHFLFNALNAISSLVVSNQREMATEMITRLAGLLRHTLSSPDAQAVTLREELALAEEYLSIEQVRFGSRLAVSVNVSLPAYDAPVPRFLLQPLVENAVRHGIARCPQGGEIVIKAFLRENRLQIEVENDRCADTLPFDDAGHGLGLANVRGRLEKLYGTQGTIKTFAGVQRFVVSVSIPVATNTGA